MTNDLATLAASVYSISQTPQPGKRLPYLDGVRLELVGGGSHVLGDTSQATAVDHLGRSSQRRPTRLLPPAGPHDTVELTNPTATPGTGMLPPPGPYNDIDCISS